MKPIRINIYKRKYKSGRSVWMVRWYDYKEGRWSALKGGDTKEEAEFESGELRRELLRGADPRNHLKKKNSLTFNEIVDLFYKSPRFKKSTISWQRIIKSSLEKRAKSYFGNLKFGEITKDKILNYYFKLKEIGLSNASIRKYHFHLCSVNDVYIDIFKEEKNIFREIKFSKFFKKTTPTRDINFLTENEIETLLNELKHAKSTIAYSFVKFLTHTGLRRGEALNLKWSDIDLEIGFISIRKSKSGQARRIPIENGAREVLKTLDKSKEFVFSKDDNKVPHKDSYIKPLQRAAKRAGINKRVDLHTLRHSYGSNKIRAGWGLKKVSKLLGHSDITMTAEVYTHLLDGDLKVSDEFHFDNLEKREEKKEEGIKGLDNTTVIQIIKLLQNQVTITGDNSETTKNNDAFCDAYATLNKKRVKK